MLLDNHKNLRAKGGSTVLMFRDLEGDLKHSCVVLEVGPKTKYKHGYIDQDKRSTYRPVKIGITAGDLAGRTIDTYDNAIHGELNRDIKKKHVASFKKDPKDFKKLQQVVVELRDDDGFVAVRSRKSTSHVVED